MGLKFVVAGATHVGRVREVNEDSYALLDDEQTWIIADGMGGHVGGQLASQTAVRAVSDFVRRWRHEADFEWPFEIMPGRTFTENTLLNAARVANVRVYNHSQSDEAYQGMGTTLVLLAYDPEPGRGLAIVHIGDSRCYRLRGGELTQLTEDHSLVNHLMRYHHLSEAQAKAKAGSNVIVRAVGLEDDVEPELTTDSPQAEDLYLTCSDGLSDMVDDWVIANILLNHHDNPEKAVSTLIQAANNAGGHDNISVVVVRALA